MSRLRMRLKLDAGSVWWLVFGVGYDEMTPLLATAGTNKNAKKMSNEEQTPGALHVPSRLCKHSSLHRFDTAFLTICICQHHVNSLQILPFPLLYSLWFIPFSRFQ